jgi:hypothetical protein
VQELVDAALLGGFEPGMTFEDAERTFGRAEEEGKNEFGPSKRYRRPVGDIEIAYQRQQSGGQTHAAWTLETFPKDGELTTILSRSVSEQIDHTARNARVILAWPDGPVVTARVSSGRVTVLSWARAPGPDGRPKPLSLPRPPP